MTSSRRQQLILLAGDGVLVGAALYLGALVRIGSDFQLYEFPLAATLFFSFIFLNSFYIFDLYDFTSFSNGPRMLQRLVMAAAGAGLFCAAFFYFSPQYRYGRGILVLAALIAVLLSYGWRKLSDRYWAEHAGPLPTLVIGTGSNAVIIHSFFQNSLSNYRLVGFVETRESPQESTVPRDHILGDTSALEQIIPVHGVEYIVVACDPLALTTPEAEFLTRTKLKGIRIDDANGFYASVTETLAVDLLRHSWLWLAGDFELIHTRIVRRIKRVGDLILSAAFLVLGLPITTLTALAIWLESAGPVFYRQKRVGKDERVFELLKFRSMHTNAESHGQPQWAKEADPRATRVGRVIRKLRIDEIPQVINVLRGDMSFIGPRPERPEFVEQLKKAIPFYHLRHYVLPGITGWAQVNYPYGATVEDAKRKLEYDLYYIINASLLLDLRIILRTVRVLVFRKGGR